MKTQGEDETMDTNCCDHFQLPTHISGGSSLPSGLLHKSAHPQYASKMADLYSMSWWPCRLRSVLAISDICTMQNTFVKKVQYICIVGFCSPVNIFCDHEIQRHPNWLFHISVIWAAGFPIPADKMLDYTYLLYLMIKSGNVIGRCSMFYKR